MHQIKKLKLFSSRLAVVFAQSIVLSREWRCSWSSADTGDALTTSEWSTIELPTKMRLDGTYFF